MRAIGLVVLWLAGTGAAIGVASAGVNVVSSEVIEPSPAIRADEAAVAATGPVSTSVAGGVPGTTAAGTDGTAATDGGADPDSGRDGAGATTDTSATPLTVPEAAADAEILTFNLVGGSASIQFSSTGVELLWASPQPGYGWSEEPEGSGIKVEFRSGDHRSRLDAWWSDGPQHEVEERS